MDLLDLKKILTEQFPEVDIDFRQTDGGFQFLNICQGNIEITIEWKPGCDFGLSLFTDKSHQLDGLFDEPNELFNSLEATHSRVVSLLKN